MIGQKDKTHRLWKTFAGMSKGDARALRVIVQLADTARAIDPDCPYGPHGVLDLGFACNGLMPTEIVKLYKLCGSNPLTLNALDYALFKQWKYAKDCKEDPSKRNAAYERILKTLPTKEAVDAALRAGDRRALKIPTLLNFARSQHRRFGQHYRPRTA